MLDFKTIRGGLLLPTFQAPQLRLDYICEVELCCKAARPFSSFFSYDRGDEVAVRKGIRDPKEPCFRMHISHICLAVRRMTDEIKSPDFRQLVEDSEPIQCDRVAVA